ncbi:FAD-dependent oxidoreductase domain-containing protein 2 [Ciona intestinalis]
MGLVRLVFICCIVSVYGENKHDAGIKHDDPMLNTDTPNYKDYCVIGAGPGGLQIAYFLESSGRDYLVFEKDHMAGSFFQKYPIHRRLLSINKIFTGKTNKDFNMRHDWNSLISNDDSLKFGKYSKEFYPNADSLLEYLNDYATKLNLKVQYNSTMHDILKRKDGLFQMWDQHNNAYTCQYMIVATGVSEPIAPKFAGDHLIEGYENLSTNLSDYKGQSVYIYGRGNAAHDVANFINGVTAVVHMLGRSPTRLAWATLYPGDTRAVNSGILDTYQLKSLDGLYEGGTNFIFRISKSLMILCVTFISVHDNVPDREGYDRFIRCIGFTFNNSVFHPTMQPSILEHLWDLKFPGITFSYQAMNYSKMYFAGSSAHSLDYRKSAGGFIHGYRYTARTLHRIMEWKHHEVQWPAVKFSNPLDLMTHMLKRVNEAADIASMFQSLCDIVVFDEEGISSSYLEAFPCALISRLSKGSGHNAHGPIIVISMQTGNFTGAGVDPFPAERTIFAASAAHRSNSLHPVFYYYNQLYKDQAFLDRPKTWFLPIPDRLLHLMEDFHFQFDGETTHILTLRRFLEDTLGRDLRNWFADDCLKMSITTSSLPLGCHGNNPYDIITRNNDLMMSSSVQLSAKFLPFLVLSY